MTNTVNATSTPLYTVILTLATLLFGNAHFMAIVFSILTLFELGTIILLFSIARGMQLPPSFVFLATSAYGLSAGMYAMSASGMETMLYIMLILAAHFLALLRTSVTRSVARIKKTF